MILYIVNDIRRPWIRNYMRNKVFPLTQNCSFDVWNHDLNKKKFVKFTVFFRKILSHHRFLFNGENLMWKCFENWQIRSSYRLYHSWRFICDRKYYVSSFHTYACTRIHFARYYFFKPTWRLKGTKWSGGRGRLSGKLLDVVCGFMGSSGRSFAAY